MSHPHFLTDDPMDLYVFFWRGILRFGELWKDPWEAWIDYGGEG